MMLWNEKDKEKSKNKNKNKRLWKKKTPLGLKWGALKMIYGGNKMHFFLFSVFEHFFIGQANRKNPSGVKYNDGFQANFFFLSLSLSLFISLSLSFFLFFSLF